MSEPKQFATLRQRNAQRARQEILAAVGRLFTDEQLDEVTIAAVARESGMSERTIYRYFPTKPTLLGEFWNWLSIESGITRLPRNESELLEAIPAAYAGFDRNEALVRAYVVSTAGRELHARSNPGRRETIEACLSQATAGLSNAERRRVCAVVQLLFSAKAWASMTESWNLSGDEAGSAAHWAVRSLLDALSRGSRPAPTTPERSAPK